MLLKELLEILPLNQACKVVYILGEEIVEVKGKASNIANNHLYLMDYEVSTAYTSSRNNCLNICL